MENPKMRASRGGITPRMIAIGLLILILIALYRGHLNVLLHFQ